MNEQREDLEEEKVWVSTEGPWTVGETYEGVPCVLWCPLPEPEPGYTICVMGDEVPEDKANARLIASAPELLFALETLAQAAFECVARVEPFYPDDAEDLRVLDSKVSAARAAISRAKGECHRDGMVLSHD